MRILLTNDDGLGAPGLDTLEAALSGDHDVWTVAPDREMSGRSHGVTLHEGLKVTALSDRRFAVRGTPADCVGISFQALMDSPPDLVISGINRGPNLGTGIVYSGTCAAAREAVLRCVPGIAVSHSSQKGPWDFKPAAEFIAARLEELRNMCSEDIFININWPSEISSPVQMKNTHPCRRRYNDEMVRFRSPRGGEYWFIQPVSIESSDEEGSDMAAVLDGFVSVGRVHAEPPAVSRDVLHDTITAGGGRG